MLESHDPVAQAETPENPYDKRFGLGFFSRVPESPGVYWFQDTRSRVIYVGRAKHLRNKLISFKYVSAARKSQKLSKLLKKISSVHWSPCLDESLTLLMEERLRQQFSPAFNETEESELKPNLIYVGLIQTSKTFIFKSNPSFSSLGSLNVFGPFKGRVVTQKYMGAFLRVLWTLLKPQQPADFPPQITKVAAPASFQLDLDPHQPPALRQQTLSDFFEGRGDAFLLMALEHLEKYKTQDHQTFVVECLNQDIQALCEFYRSGPHRNWRFRHTNELPLDSTLGEWQDDLILNSQDLLAAKS